MNIWVGKVHKIVLDKKLRSIMIEVKLRGILQKFINCRVKIAIVGDFSVYSSNSLKDFIRESNQGKDIFFQPDEEQAIAKLSEGLGGR
ncbi:hypothetical protein KCTCHS21_34580 [Cohnella abietis]|uniref:DUF4180 domain-containing protein n=1 Tax=Cohnella abietis TaxID=2507935 RepID=A0A3T1D7N2_9BACL|nr:hypothetical protein KCTCHS21_34580 [Cohnella abietis]